MKTKRISFKSPISPADVIELQVYINVNKGKRGRPKMRWVTVAEAAKSGQLPDSYLVPGIEIDTGALTRFKKTSKQ